MSEQENQSQEVAAGSFERAVPTSPGLEPLSHGQMVGKYQPAESQDDPQPEKTLEKVAELVAESRQQQLPIGGDSVGDCLDKAQQLQAQRGLRAPLPDGPTGWVNEDGTTFTVPVTSEERLDEMDIAAVTGIPLTEENGFSRWESTHFLQRCIIESHTLPDGRECYISNFKKTLCVMHNRSNCEIADAKGIEYGDVSEYPQYNDYNVYSGFSNEKVRGIVTTAANKVILTDGREARVSADGKHITVLDTEQNRQIADKLGIDLNDVSAYSQYVTDFDGDVMGADSDLISQWTDIVSHAITLSDGRAARLSECGQFVAIENTAENKRIADEKGIDITDVSEYPQYTGTGLWHIGGSAYEGDPSVNPYEPTGVQAIEDAVVKSEDVVDTGVSGFTAVMETSYAKEPSPLAKVMAALTDELTNGGHESPDLWIQSVENPAHATSMPVEHAIFLCNRAIRLLLCERRDIPTADRSGAMLAVIDSVNIEGWITGLRAVTIPVMIKYNVGKPGLVRVNEAAAEEEAAKIVPASTDE